MQNLSAVPSQVPRTVVASLGSHPPLGGGSVFKLAYLAPGNILPCYIDECYEGSLAVMVTFLDGEGGAVLASREIVELAKGELRRRAPQSNGPLYGVTMPRGHLLVTAFLGYPDAEELASNP